MNDNILPIGTKIWCPVFFAHEPGVTFHDDLSRPLLFRDKFKLNLFFAVLSPWYCTSKWWVSNRPTSQPSIACFCLVDIPENWTHFVVVSKENGFRVVFPTAGSEAEVVKHYIPYNKLPHSTFPTI